MHDWTLAHEYDFHGRAVRYGIMGRGPAVVVVHGTPWSSFNLRHILRGLASDFTLYYFDLLGYGQSDKSEGDVSLGVQNRVLDELIAHWGLERPLAIGHDFGGATVLRTHLLNRRDFRKMVLIDPVAIAPWGSPFFRHVQQHEEAFVGLPAYIHEAIVRAYVQTAAHRAIEPDTLEAMVAPWTGPSGQAAFYRQIAQADSRFTNEVQPLYETIATPVLILWGAEDTWIPLERAHALHESIPGSQLITVPDAGHLVIEEKPQPLVQAIAEFFT